MYSQSLREKSRELSFEAIHLDYLIALSETRDGHFLVENLISVYLERASEILICAGSGVFYSDFANFKVSLLHLSIGSERIGATRLAQRLNTIVDMDPHSAETNLNNLLEEVSNEFESARRELQAIASLLRPT